MCSSQDTFMDGVGGCNALRIGLFWGLELRGLVRTTGCCAGPLTRPTLEITWRERFGLRTKTASIDLLKLLLNSVLSCKGAKFVTLDIKNFYLQTPLDRPEYVRIKLADIPKDFIDK